MDLVRHCSNTRPPSSQTLSNAGGARAKKTGGGVSSRSERTRARLAVAALRTGAARDVHGRVRVTKGGGSYDGETFTRRRRASAKFKLADPRHSKHDARTNRKYAITSSPPASRRIVAICYVYVYSAVTPWRQSAAA